MGVYEESHDLFDRVHQKIPVLSQRSEVTAVGTLQQQSASKPRDPQPCIRCCTVSVSIASMRTEGEGVSWLHSHRLRPPRQPSRVRDLVSSSSSDVSDSSHQSRVGALVDGGRTGAVLPLAVVSALAAVGLLALLGVLVYWRSV